MPFFYRYMEKTEDDVDELIKKIHVDLNMLKETGLQEFELVLLRDIITRWSPDVMNDSDERMIRMEWMPWRIKLVCQFLKF